VGVLSSGSRLIWNFLAENEKKNTIRYPGNIQQGTAVVVGRKAGILANCFSLQITKFLNTWMILERLSFHKRIEEWQRVKLLCTLLVI
jgi:cystathionine beta-lyase/cystathionine gamma-synthase